MTPQHAIVFVGPTITLDDASRVLDATYLPPAALGDITRAVHHRPRVIGLIDGYFEHRPAVWHKEILFALSRGIHVVGASSMGALRAAELEAFGMEGIGQVFADFQSGRLTRDDEVAVAHTVDDGTYFSTNEALVNIRATLSAAVTDAVLTQVDADTMLEAARAQFYPLRSWVAVVDDALASDAAPCRARLANFETWLPNNRVDVKHADAVALLERVRDLCADPFEPKTTQFHFEQSGHWQNVTTVIDPTAPLDESPYNGAVLDELRLDAEMHREISGRATIRALALVLADEAGARPTQSDVQQHIDEYRHQHDLGPDNHVAEWVARNDLDEAIAKSLLVDDARVKWALRQTDDIILQCVFDTLKLDDRYAALADRARQKAAALTARGTSAPSPKDLGIDEDLLLSWYREHHLDGVEWDRHQMAGNLGFPDAHRMIEAIAREYAFAQLDTP